MVSFAGVCSGAALFSQGPGAVLVVALPCPADIAAQLFDFILPNVIRSDSKSILYAQDRVGCLNNHSHPDVNSCGVSSDNVGWCWIYYTMKVNVWSLTFNPQEQVSSWQ